MKPLFLQPNKERTAFSTNSDYTRSLLAEWMKTYDLFEIKPVVKDSKNRRRYLEGAVIPAYCQWQYGIDPREKGKGDMRRILFKRDFHSEIVRDRAGLPVKIPLSSLGKSNEILEKYCEWATENGAPVPNPELYKLYRDQYSMDRRWDDFYHWLAFLEIECDAMPSSQLLEKLDE